MDKKNTIYPLVWNTYSGSIRILLDNHYIFQPFWDYQNGLISEGAWQSQFQHNKKRVTKALQEQNKYSCDFDVLIFSNIHCNGLMKSDQGIDQIEFALNHRPRKTLGWYTPSEVMAGFYTVALAA